MEATAGTVQVRPQVLQREPVAQSLGEKGWKVWGASFRFDIEEEDVHQRAEEAVHVYTDPMLAVRHPPQRAANQAPSYARHMTS
jgi:hypothetical protein